MRYFLALTLALGGAVLLSRLDAYEWFYHFSRGHEAYELDEIILSIPGVLLAVVFLLAHTTMDLRREVKARKQAEREAREALKFAQLQEEMKKTFLIQASHDLNSPVTGLVGMLQTLAVTTSPEKNEQFLALALASAQSLKDTVSSVLSFTRMDRSDPSLSFEDFAPETLLNSCLARFRPLAQTKRTILTGEMMPGTPRTVHAHRGVTQIVLDNLMSNSIKFTEGGTITARIGYIAGAGQLLLEVQDTGRGLTEAERQNIFHPFFRAQTAETEGIPGLGIGLSVVCDLVELLGGSLSVDSTPGQGSRFTATLPG